LTASNIAVCTIAIRRADLGALPDRRVVVRFEFSGVPASRTKYKLFWLVLERAGVDVCVKDPGFGIDLVFRGDIRDFVALFLGHVEWHESVGKTLAVEGARHDVKQLPVWLRPDKVVGRDFPILPSAA
jgi:hypothetical protein